jgi:bifunctional non-homologous end joining protein LigD
VALAISSCCLFHPLTDGTDVMTVSCRMTTKKRSAKTTKTAKANSFCSAARAVRMPAEIHPMLATLVDEPFSDPEWIFETKWDGFRSICFIRNGDVRFVSRNQIEMTPQYPELAKVGKQVSAREAILDGEIVALDKDGMPRFQLLQNKLRIRSGSYAPARTAQIIYFVFDLLYVDGYDLRNCTVVERKKTLAKILQPAKFIKLSEHVEGEGVAFFREIEKFHLEGMIAKRADSKYLPRRSSDWLKVKTIMRAEVVVAGYTQPRATRSHFGSLVCGLYRGNELHYVAHTGGGFNEKLLSSIYKLMQPLRIDKSAFVKPPKTNEPVQWIKPKLVAEIKFSEWTADNRLRQPIFVGLREDKDPKDCRFEFESDTDTVVEKAEKRGKAKRRG